MRMTTRGAILKPTNTVVRVNGTQKFTVSGTSATVDFAWTKTGRISVDNTTSNSVTITGRVEGNDVLVVALSDGTELTSTVLISNTAEIPPTEPEPEPEPTPPSPTVVPVTGITADEWEVCLEVGQTKKINASVIPKNATNKTLHWWVEYPWVATVDSSGLITATGVGYTPATVTTDEGNYIWTIHVNVSEATTPIPPVPPQPIYGDIVVNKTNITVQEGQSEAITISLDKEPTNQQYLTISKNNNNITIDKDVLSFDSSNWNVGQIVNVLGVVDLANHSDRTSKIIISSDNVESKTIAVVVRTSYVAVSSVVLDVTSASLYVGDLTTLKATVSPSNATNKSLRWTSDSDCVSVDQNGNIVAVKKGTATITVNSVDGNKSAKCVVEVVERITEPTNNPPTISMVKVTSQSYDGSYTLQYTADDVDGDTLTHRLKFDNSEFSRIYPLKTGTTYAYNGIGLSTGIHTGIIQVSDGKEVATSDTFTVRIEERPVITGVKAELKEAKDVYDRRHGDLVNTIMLIVEDGVFDADSEKQQLDDAFMNYNTALANLKRMIQKSLDFISDAKKMEAVDESKAFTSAQITIMSDSIKQEVSSEFPTRDELNESIGGLATIEQVNNSLQGLIDQSHTILDKLEDLTTDLIVMPNEKLVLHYEYIQIVEKYNNLKTLIDTINNPTFSSNFADLTAYYVEVCSVLEPLFVDMGAETEADESVIYEKIIAFYRSYETLLRLVYTMLNSDVSNVKTEVTTLANGVQTAITSSNEALGVTQKVGKHFDFTADGWVRIYASLNGERGQFMTQITDRRMSFYDGETEVAYVSNKDLYITNAHILDNLVVGSVSLVKSATGGIIFNWND